LPHVIEAMFIGPGDGEGVGSCYGNACVRSVRDVRRDFLRAYRLRSADVPLVRYHIGVGFVAA
jgi:hypothetical protein